MNQHSIMFISLGLGNAAEKTGKPGFSLQDAVKVYTRDPEHPGWRILLQDAPLVDIREKLLDRKSLQSCIEDILASVGDGDVVYASAAVGLGMDYFAVRLAEEARKRGINAVTKPSESFLDQLIQQFGYQFASGVSFVDCLQLVHTHVPPFPPTLPVILLGVDSSAIAEKVKANLENSYPADHLLIKLCLDKDGAWLRQEVSIGKLVENWAAPGEDLLVPALGKDTSFEAFQELVAQLRAPDGCPWDREQTHASLRANLLEETYEALAALDQSDWGAVREELGDLLLQILLHTQIATEYQEFTMPQVIHTIHSKLVRRHPHVFAQVEVDGIGGILRNWEDIKAQERKTAGNMLKGLLDGVPKTYPALAQSQDIQSRAARVGFDWAEFPPVLEKVREELDELLRAEDMKEKTAELGDLLFAVVNVSRWLGIEAESALRQTNERFRRRFRYIEEAARSTGKNLKDMTLAEMDELWEQAKGQE